MANQIIILDKNAQSGLFRCVLWADVPVARRPFYADASLKSAWTGAVAAEIIALTTGAVVERVIELAVSDGATVAQIQAELISRRTLFQAEVTARNPWLRYGTRYDGTTWTAGGAT